MTRRSKEQKYKKSVSRLQACCAVAGLVVLLGAVAVILLPREEEPQIKVPMIDVMLRPRTITTAPSALR